MDLAAESPSQPLLVGVRFRETGKIYDYDSGSLLLCCGDQVIVATEHGTALGIVVVPPREVGIDPSTARPQRVIKKADARDLARDEANQRRAHEALRICLHRINEQRLPMKLIKADCLFDGTKIVFYFVADGRVDFRQLVRDLAHTLHTRIEMKQIGARDETKMLGGIAPCGRELCCSSWLKDFAPVSVKMAKEQGLSLNPSKLAGMCGRLKCCLRYEYETYLELGRSLPAVGRRVESVKGNGVVARHNVLKQNVVLKRDEDGVEAEVTLDELVEKRAQ